MNESIASTTTTTADPNSRTTTTTTPSEITLLIENPGKGKNWGPLLRCCAAFGIRTIYVVGYDKCDVRGSHGASKHVRLVAFPTHERALQALNATTVAAAAATTTTNEVEGFNLVGLLPPPYDEDCHQRDWDDDDDDFDKDRAVIQETIFYGLAKTELDIVRISANDSGESSKQSTTGEEKNQGELKGITHSKTTAATTEDAFENKMSFPVHKRSRFPRRTCLVVDKLKAGLPWSLARHCSSFVHIPQSNFNPNGSMLTLEASLSIIFHEVMNAGFVGFDDGTSDNTSGEHTTDYEGQKYHVEMVHKGGNPNDTEARQRKRKEREDKMDKLRDEEANEDKQQLHSLLFGDTNDGGDY